MIRAVLLVLLLAGCATTRDLICNGPSDSIAANDPGLKLIRDRDDDPEGVKVALAIERTNNCP